MELYSEGNDGGTGKGVIEDNHMCEALSHSAVDRNVVCQCQDAVIICRRASEMPEFNMDRDRSTSLLP